jgi:hypothetical protein
VECVAFSRDGQWLISCGQDLRLKVWCLPKGALSYDGSSIYFRRENCDFALIFQVLPEISGDFFQGIPMLEFVWRIEPHEAKGRERKQGRPAEQSP